MLFFTLSFLLGDLYLQTLEVLPSLSIIFYWLIFSLLGNYFLYKKLPYFYIIPAILSGLLYSDWYATQVLATTLPKSLETQPILITGCIASIPHAGLWQTNFLFDLERADGMAIHPMLGEMPKIRLHWHSEQNNTLIPFHIGDEWQFQVRLKRIHGLQSPGALDYEAYAIQDDLRATGTIIASDHNHLIQHHRYLHWLDQLRERIRNKLLLYLPHTPTAPWLLALMIGDKENLPQANWDILRATGTNHLMAIAGLHIGSLAGLTYLIIHFCWRRSASLCLRLPATLAATYAALVAALLFSACAGFSLPTQRACIMLTVLSVLMIIKRRVSPWQIWSVALLAVLLLNPLSVLTESIWLSFITIALLIYGMRGRLVMKNIWWEWGRAQWVISVGLLPLSLVLFQQCALIGVVANIIAIPYLTFLILPFCFLSLLFLPFSSTVTQTLLWMADKNVAGLWHLLSWFAAQPYAVWSYAMPNWHLAVMAMIACIFLLLPRGMPGRWLSIIWFAPLLTYHAPSPKPGELWLSLLDVGQGLSVVLQTASHTLVYDTGPALGGQDAGQEVVVPYLRTLHLKKVDMLVISHGDNDHIGGSKAVLSAMPVLQIKTSAVDKLPSPLTHYCLAGEAWQWDNIKFAFIYPFQNVDKSNNDTSCVLRVNDGKHVILLPGDIEKKAEHALLANSPHLLQTSLLVAPHHGSKTSGGMPFIKATHPTWVLFATGYLNRYHFPHPSVVKAYEVAQTHSYNAPWTGTLTFKFDPTLDQPTILAYRLSHPHYWQDKPQ